jgi:hypothetical protein
MATTVPLFTTVNGLETRVPGVGVQRITFTDLEGRERYFDLPEALGVGQAYPQGDLLQEDLFRVAGRWVIRTYVFRPPEDGGGERAREVSEAEAREWLARHAGPEPPATWDDE